MECYHPFNLIKNINYDVLKVDVHAISIIDIKCD